MAGETRACHPLQWWSICHDGRYTALRSHLDSKSPRHLHETTSNIEQAGANGAQQAGSWACRETFVAVVIGNVPMIYPLFRRVARRAGLYITSRSGSESYPAYPLSGENADGEYGRRRRKFHHPLSIPETQWNTTMSDEQMILPTSRQEPPTCTAGERDWDANSQGSQGIKVVHETIVHSAEKTPRR